MRALNRKRVTTMLENIFVEEDLHAKRLDVDARVRQEPVRLLHAVTQLNVRDLRVRGADRADGCSRRLHCADGVARKRLQRCRSLATVC